jgi:hypothetical protein
VRSIAEFEPLTEERHVAVDTAAGAAAVVTAVRRALDDVLRDQADVSISPCSSA